jgi:hypothetical protein
MAFTYYASTDAGAPTLSGTAGALITVLDAILVNGYGAKAAAGWSKAYSGVNKAAYRAPSGSQLYLRVQDDAPVTAKEARLTGYEAMTDVDTGTGPFPTAAQGVGGVAMTPGRKSTSADGTARTWHCFADARTIYFVPDPGDAAPALYHEAWMFGEIYSLSPGDAYNCMIVGRAAENSATGSNDQLDKYCAASLTSTSAGHFMARSYTATGGSLLVGKHWDTIKGAGTIVGIGNIPYPNPQDGGLYLSRVWINEVASSGSLRGRMRGFWQMCHPVASVNHLDTLSGTGDLAGRTFIFIKTTGNAGAYCFETSDTLETN